MLEAAERAIEAVFPVAELVSLLEALPAAVHRRVEAAEAKAAADMKTVAAWAEKAIGQVRTDTEAMLDAKVTAALAKATGGVDLTAAKAAIAGLIPAEPEARAEVGEGHSQGEGEHHDDGHPDGHEGEGGQAVEVEHAG